MVLYLFVSGVLLTHLRRPVSRMTVSEQQLEGEFRYVNSRLITNAEEVAFYRGNVREKHTMLTAFTRLVILTLKVSWFIPNKYNFYS
jgi:ATP-binding cassette, subfamily D (ALD), member 3